MDIYTIHTPFYVFFFGCLQFSVCREYSEIFNTCGLLQSIYYKTTEMRHNPQSGALEA
jgi:hypothetical protein